VQSQILSFEDNNIQKWSATKGNISISSDKAKVGDSSLKWDWKAGDVLSATEPGSLKSVSTGSMGGVNMWIYNTNPKDKTMRINFYNSSGDKKCGIDFNLNFKGWRCLWACFREDMQHDRTQLSSMKIEMPGSGSGTVYIDYLEFVTTSSWQRMPDFQSRIIKGDGTYIELRETQYPASVQPDEEQATAIQTIADKFDKWYLGSGKYESDNIYKSRANAVAKWIQNGCKSAPVIESNGTVEKSGLFSLGFDGNTVDEVKLKTFKNINETNLLQLAFDYRINRNEASLTKAKEIYDWYYDQGWADGSALGTLYLEMLRSGGFYHSVFLLRDNLSGEQQQRISDAEKWYTRLGQIYDLPDTQGELADYLRSLAVPKLQAILMMDDKGLQTASLDAYREYLNNALSYAPGFAGTLKPDGSGYHHRGTYLSAYYPDALNVGCLLYYLLHDTPFALDEQIFDNLKKALLSYRFLCAEYHVPGGTTGRFPAGSEVLHTLLPAYSYLILTDETPDKELLGAFKRLWNPEHASLKNYLGRTATDICYTKSLGEVEMLLDAAYLNENSEDSPVGSKYMPYSGLLVYRQTDWMFTVKGFSKYIWDYESSGSENVYGRYLSYGNVEYSDLKNGLRSHQSSTWDWLHIPGTTARQISLSQLDYNTTGSLHRNFSDQTFLGGIGFDNSNAVFTNRIHDNAIDKTFYADKSVFVFGNIVYCMGSGINTSSDNSEIHTTLYQNATSNSLNFVEKIDNTSVKDNFGNVYIAHKGDIITTDNGSFVTGYINHGSKVSDAEYAYSWLIQPEDEDVSAYKTNSPIEILRQNDSGHAIWHKEQKILFASIFKRGNITGLRQITNVTKPMIIAIKEGFGKLDIAFSNPDMDRRSAANNNAVTSEIEKEAGKISSLSFKITGEYLNAETESDISVTFKDGITTILYPYSQNGETYRVTLADNVTSLGNDEKNLVRILKEGDDYVVTTDDEATFISVYTVHGVKIKSLKTNSRKTYLNLYSYPKGIYFINVELNNTTYTEKVIL